MNGDRDANGVLRQDARAAGSKGGFKDLFFRIPPLWRDIGAAVSIIFILMFALWGYTGQPFPSQAPLVVVESGSMMHEDPTYGRFGTIDPGDLILVKVVDGPDDIVTRYGAADTVPPPERGAGDRSGYGFQGDVVIYRPRGDTTQTPIIHRVVTWVEVERQGGAKCFSYHDEFGHYGQCRPDVHLPEIGIEHVTTYETSGWITKGDNPKTNREADQESIIPGLLVEPEWIIGKARGEIPWVGLLKFIFQGNTVRVVESDWCQVGLARAPCDTFVMLWVSLGVLILVPLGLEFAAYFMRTRDDDDDGPGTGGALGLERIDGTMRIDPSPPADGVSDDDSGLGEDDVKPRPRRIVRERPGAEDEAR